MAQWKAPGLSSYHQSEERSHHHNGGVGEPLPMNELLELYDMVLVDVGKDGKEIWNVSRDMADWRVGPNAAKGGQGEHL